MKQNTRELIAQLVRERGPCEAPRFVEELIHTALKLVSDGATQGDLRMINAALKEMRYSCRVFKPYREARKVSIFGSARTPPDSALYAQTRDFARQIADQGYMVITGAGPGIMQAGNEGAGRERSFGLNIRLPFEQDANPVIAGDPKLINYRYFFTRKLSFVKETSAMVCFPGGFGTSDELFETLTLLQTGRSPLMPIVLMDEPGGYFWRSWENRVLRQLVGRKLISDADVHLFDITDDLDNACEIINKFYRVFHSMRAVHDTLVLRVRTWLPEDLLQDLNYEFRDILNAGIIEQGEALPEEENEPHLQDMPRLLLKFNNKSFGRLRKFIDHVNETPMAPGETRAAPGSDPAGEATADLSVELAGEEEETLDEEE